jgi:MazG family protein
MQELDELNAITDALIGPNGCPWYQEQTLQSLRQYIVGEVYELVEAIDLDDDEKILDELSDLLFNLNFICRLCEKEKQFTLQNVIKNVCAKLIRRSPHVFDDKKASTPDEAAQLWAEMKKKEKNASERSSVIDGIPKELPTIARATKVLKSIDQTHYKREGILDGEEEEAGFLLLEVIDDIRCRGIMPEQALRKVLTKLESEFRQWEKKNES